MNNLKWIPSWGQGFTKHHPCFSTFRTKSICMYVLYADMQMDLKLILIVLFHAECFHIVLQSCFCHMRQWWWTLNTVPREPSILMSVAKQKNITCHHIKPAPNHNLSEEAYFCTYSFVINIKTNENLCPDQTLTLTCHMLQKLNFISFHFILCYFIMMPCEIGYHTVCVIWSRCRSRWTSYFSLGSFKYPYVLCYTILYNNVKCNDILCSLECSP